MNQYPNLSLAIKKSFEAEADAFLAQLEPDPDFTLSAKTELKILNLAKRRDKTYYPLICTLGRRIACVVAVIVVFAVSAMSIKPVRAAVVEFFTDVFSNHTQMTTTHDVIPAGTSEFIEHKITVPEGFELVEKNTTNISVYALYNDKDKYIIYKQINSEYYSADYDNERSTFENYTNDDGLTFIIIETDNNNIIIWKDSNYVYNIESNLTKSEILNLCNQTNITE